MQLGEANRNMMVTSNNKYETREREKETRIDMNTLR